MRPSPFQRILSTLLLCGLASSALASAALVSSAFAAHPLIMNGNGKLAKVAASGEVEWEMPWGGIHDIHVLANGHIMVQERMQKIVEIDPAKKEVVWSYDAANMNGNKGKRIEVHAFQPLDGDRIMVAESGVGRIIEIDRSGKILHEVKLKVLNPHPHRDTRLVRKIANGNYLVCHEGDGTLREYNGKSGKVVWEYDVPMFGKEPKGGHGPEGFGNSLFAAVRLENGNTLIATGNGHSVLEVTRQKKIVWKVDQNDLPGITLAWVTTLEVLPNGNYVIGNCHAGPDNPLLVELDPKTKKVVWQFDRFDLFGNSAPNSQLLGVAGGTNR
jgi:outer membrane protein assembly factor BamB